VGFVVEKMALEKFSFQILQFWRVTDTHLLTLHTHLLNASFFNPSNGEFHLMRKLTKGLKTLESL
jgi:hypothetical protein